MPPTAYLMTLVRAIVVWNAQLAILEGPHTTPVACRDALAVLQHLSGDLAALPVPPRYARLHQAVAAAISGYSAAVVLSWSAPHAAQLDLAQRVAQRSMGAVHAALAELPSGIPVRGDAAGVGQGSAGV